MPSSEPPFTLYYNRESVCSTMVRLTWAFRGLPDVGSPCMQLVAEPVDISHKVEQLAEKFLCEVNHDGQVPVLCNDKVLGRPMPDSVKITYFICSRYPSLLPVEHEGKIRMLLDELHRISFYALTFEGMPEIGMAHLARIDELLAMPGISDRYRKALSYKKERRIENEQQILPDCVSCNERLSRDFLAKVDSILQSNGRTSSSYIYGDDPTVLDAHVLPFLRRLNEKHRMHVIPERVQAYFYLHKDSDIWCTLLPQ